RGRHPSLPLPIFGYALALYLEQRGASALTVSLNELAYGAGAPGRVFCLSEAGLLTRLESLGALTGGLPIYDETPGLKQVLLHKSLRPRDLLERYYGESQKVSPWQRVERGTKR